ncbi:MAG: DUF2808 domain-containing protein [Gloeobacterales cyanobacterium]
MNRPFRRRTIFGLVLVSFLGLGVRGSWAQGGMVLNQDPDKVLKYATETGQRGIPDRYYLTLKPQKFAVYQIQIRYESSFDGKFYPQKDKIEVYDAEIPFGTKDKPLFTVEQAEWDKEARLLSIELSKPIPAGVTGEIALDRVDNPTFEGIYNLQARVLNVGPFPSFRYIGTWSITIQ